MNAIAKPEPKPVAISAENVCASLSGKQVLFDVNLQLSAGQWTCILGPNGAGKSTLLKALAGVLPHTGQVSLMGNLIESLPHRVRAQQLAWLGQNETSADDLTVVDVVMLGRLPHQAWLAPPNEKDWKAVERALRCTQAWDWRNRPLGQLSGGERQRVLLARALAVEAQVLLMDEPLANLDPPHQGDWLCVVEDLVAQGTTVVSVLHEISMALHADALVVMREGRITHHGLTHETTTHEAVKAAFDHRIAIHAVGNQWVALPDLQTQPGLPPH